MEDILIVVTIHGGLKRERGGVAGQGGGNS